ncbi:hypothetical protein ES705_36257 [subsurface metagenome]
MLNELKSWRDPSDGDDIINLGHACLGVFLYLHVEVIVSAWADVRGDRNINVRFTGGKFDGFRKVYTDLAVENFIKARRKPYPRRLVLWESAPITDSTIEGNCPCQPSIVKADIHAKGIAIGELNLLPSNDPNRHARVTDDFYACNIHRCPPGNLNFFVAGNFEVLKLGFPENVKNIQKGLAKNVSPRHTHYLGI